MSIADVLYPVCIAGIDPGITGAVAIYFPVAPDRVAVRDMPVAGGEIDAANLAAIFKQYRPDMVFLERAAARPGQGVSSMFKFGSTYGCIRGVVSTLQIPLYLITPQIWKKSYRLPSDKEASRALALRLFPGSPEHFARKKDHGRAEAALLARYGAGTQQREAA